MPNKTNNLLDLSRLQEIIDLTVSEPLSVKTLLEWGFIPNPAPPTLTPRLRCQCCEYDHAHALVIWRPTPLHLLLVSHNQEEASSLVPLVHSIRAAMDALSPDSLKEVIATDQPISALLPYALIGTITLCNTCYSHITRMSPLAAGRHPVSVAKRQTHNKRVGDAIIEYLNHCNTQRVMPTFEAIAQYIHTRGFTTMTGKPFSSANIYKLMKETGITRTAYCRVYEWGRTPPTTNPTDVSTSIPATTPVADTQIPVPVPLPNPTPTPENRWITEEETDSEI